MPYQNNVPQPTDAFSDSQADLLANFSGIKTLIDVDHVTFDAADEGKHNQVTFPEQAAGPATAVNEGALYTKVSGVSVATELFFRRENNGTEIEFTISENAAIGWTRLPSGLLVRWGTGTANGSAAINFAGGTFPGFTNVYSVSLTTEENVGAPNTFITLSSFTNTAITAVGSQRTAVANAATNFRYLAIGD